MRAYSEVRPTALMWQLVQRYSRVTVRAGYFTLLTPDRDRAGPHDPAPPTPPGKRITHQGGSMTCFTPITVPPSPAAPGSGRHLWAKRTPAPGFRSGATGHGPISQCSRPNPWDGPASSPDLPLSPFAPYPARTLTTSNHQAPDNPHRDRFADSPATTAH